MVTPQAVVCYEADGAGHATRPPYSIRKNKYTGAAVEIIDSEKRMVAVSIASHTWDGASEAAFKEAEEFAVCLRNALNAFYKTGEVK